MAENIREIYHLFNPDQVLLNDELKKYYVEIEQNETNIKDLQIRLELGLETREPIKLLFTGHRGSGKTTTLNRLVSNLDNRFFIVHYNVFDLLDQNDVNYTDVLFSILTKMLEKVEKENIDLGETLMKRVNNWGSSIIKSKIHGKIKEGGAGIKIHLNLFEFMGRMKSETTTRVETRKKIEPRVSELVSIINDTISEIETTGKQVLIIIDNLEKIDSEKALHLFYHHGTQLTQPLCKIIYTFPISLKSSNDFMQIRINFSDVLIHPNIKINEREGVGHPYPKGREFMKEIVSKRVSLELFEPDALEYIIDMSGGVVREFIRIIRDSAVRAITKNKDIIDKDIAMEVVNGLKNIYQAQLSDEDYQVLQEVHHTKDIKKDEKLVGLLHNLSVLEYRNDRSWCDLNPIVRAILDEKNLL
ncbi:MAG: AAA family ATPase [Methanosarcinales archaeon]|nr:AAA family ATPase [Methanosarcinales archaeon]